MNDPIIAVEQLGKRYRLHHAPKAPYRTLREAITGKMRRLLTPQVTDPSAAKDEEFWALRDVNFEIQRGEVVGVIGRNGAGKSTLLKILSRITEPTTGRIRLRGRVASLLEVGTGFHPELTGRENIFLNGAILGMGKTEIRSKFDEIVAFAEVEKFLDTPVKHYSSGMYVRLAFAVAAHLDPEILVVDEVLAVGDAEFQKKCLGKMHAVSSEGRTVLFVSHNMEAMDRLTNRCIYLIRGNVSRDGPTSRVVSQYLREGTNEAQDIAHFRSRSVAGTVILTTVRVESLAGDVSSSFRQGEPFRVVLEVDCARELTADFAVVIENEQHVPLYTTHLSDLGAPLVTQGKRMLAAEFREPMLRRGNYSVSIAAFSPDKQVFYDVVTHYPLLEIAGTLGSAFPDDARWGNLYLPVQWKVDS